MSTYREFTYAPVATPEPVIGWWTDAACRGESTEIFYPRPSEHAVHRKVIETYCDRCPVREACLADDLESDGPLWGIRGGFSAADRERILGKRKPRTGKAAA